MIGQPALSPAGDRPVRSVADMIAYLERCNEADERMIAGRVYWCEQARKRIEERKAQIATLRGEA